MFEEESLMRLLAIAAATLLAAGIAAAPASAKGYPPPGWHGNHGHGWHGHRHKVCRTVWRHHHRVRQCSWR
jgi:Spy/CpxP family protein refolding chaperone